MDAVLIAGSSNPPLAQEIAHLLGVTLGNRILTRAPDGELQVEIRETVRARDVFLIQPTAPPPDQNLMELMLLADTCRRAGANHITAIAPYFAYARQDRSASGLRAVAAHLIAELLRNAGLGRIVAVDLHTTSIESAFGIALEHLSAVTLLSKALVGRVPADSIVVAPDMGAVRLAEQYARALNLPMAIIHKLRISSEEVVAHTLIGQVQGRTPLIVDDMIVTGATIEAALKLLLASGSRADVTVAATHGLLVGPAATRLAALPIKRLLVTDSILIPSGLPLPIEITSLAPLLAEVISRLHSGKSLSDLLEGN